MRIVAWNIENIAPWLAGGLPEQVAALGNPDVLCLQEVKLRPRDTELVDKVRTLLPGYTAHLALCDDPRNVTFRGGRAYGVATFVRGDATSEHPAWDREGRVLVTRVGDLAIVNLYAVNGTDKPYVDPDTGLLDGDRHAFKRRFQERVVGLGATFERCVIAGDWNVSQTALDVTPRLRTEEPHATARRELAELFAKHGFVDVFRARHPEVRQYTWFARGRRDHARVDYIVVSKALVDRVAEARILDDKALRPRSDHAPLVVEL